MKKKLCLIMVFIFIVSTSLALSEKVEAASITLGDVNSDGSLDTIDLALVQKHILGIGILEGNALLAADVDASGYVDTIDLDLIKNYLLELITEFPGENQEPSDDVGITWMDGKALFPLGVNYAWYNWCYDFSDYNWSANFNDIKSHMDTMSEIGVHSLRWWIFPDLAWGPTWSGDQEGSLCTGLPDNWVENMKEACDYALSKDIKIYWTVTSFDVSRPDDSIDHDDVIDDAEIRQSFLDNALKPILLALGNHEGVMGWDVINEPEWIVSSEDGGGARTDGYEIFSLESMRSYIKTTVEYIQQYAEQPVSFGSANMKWLGAQYDLWDGLGVDFYDFHWYDWATPWFNPVTTPASSLNLDKPVIIGEMMPDTESSSLNMTHKEVLDAIYANGYAGYLLWSWNDGSINCRSYIGNNFLEFEAEHTDVVR